MIKNTFIESIVLLILELVALIAAICTGGSIAVIVPCGLIVLGGAIWFVMELIAKLKNKG